MWPTTRTLKNECGAAFNGDEDMTFDQAIQSMKKAYTDRLNWNERADNKWKFRDRRRLMKISNE